MAYDPSTPEEAQAAAAAEDFGNDLRRVFDFHRMRLEVLVAYTPEGRLLTIGVPEGAIGGDFIEACKIDLVSEKRGH